MRALRLHGPGGGPERLVWEETSTPSPGTGDALVRVRAASYTPGELQWPPSWTDRRGHERFPAIPSHEVSGVVVALGWGTTGVQVGDEVYGLTDFYRDGAAAQYVAVEARNLAPKPVTVEHAAACTIPMPGLTAWQGLFVHGRLQRGQTVLVIGAGGGVGALAVQLACSAGARVVGTGFASARDTVVGLGADVFVEAHGPDFRAVGPVDVVFDTVGGTALEDAWPLVKPAGSVVSIVEPPSPHRTQQSGARGTFFVVQPDRDALIELAGRIDAAEIRPLVGSTVALERGHELIARKERGGLSGKIALTVNGA